MIFILEDNNLNKEMFIKGMKDAIPIGLGYLAVSFSLGISAAHAGLTPIQAFFSAFLNSSSTGQYAGYQVIQVGGTLIEIALITLIANARYALMSSVVAQRLNPETPERHRYLMALGITDEIFALTINQDNYLNPYYTYGLIVNSLSWWAIGTMIGTFAGGILSSNWVSALSVALYGMFIAIIIPDMKTNPVIKWLVPLSFILSMVVHAIPFIAQIPESILIIILTVVLATAVSIVRPIEEGVND